MTAVVLVAHGSRDPRSAHHLERLRARVAPLAPGTRVHLGYLEQREPSVEAVLRAEPDDVVVVPLLLGNAFHARVDLPSRLDAIARARAAAIETTPVLGHDEAMLALVREEIERQRDEHDVDAAVLMGAGTSDVNARAEMAAIAATLSREVAIGVTTGYSSTAEPIGDAVAALNGSGSRVGVVPWFLAPGLLLDRGLAAARAAGAVAVSELTLADTDAAAHLTMARVRDVLHRDGGRSAA